MKTNELKVNILNATHMRTQVIFTVLDFLRAQSTSPVGSGFSLPGTSPVRKSACETAESSRLFEREARVKAT